MDQILTVEIKNGPSLLLVDFEAMLDGIHVDVVQPVFAQRAALEPLGELFHVGADEVQDGANIEGVMEGLRLREIAGNAIEHEGVAFRVEMTEGSLGLDIL